MHKRHGLLLLALAATGLVLFVSVADGAGPPVSPAISAATLAALPPGLIAVPAGGALFGADTATTPSGRAGVQPASGVGACGTVGTQVERSSNTVVLHAETVCTAGSHINAFGGCIYRDGFTTVACNFFPVYFSDHDASLAIVGHCESGLHTYWANGSVNWTPLGGSSRNYPWSTPVSSTIIC